MHASKFQSVSAEFGLKKAVPDKKVSVHVPESDGRFIYN